MKLFPRTLRLYAVEKLTLIYIAFTSIVALFFLFEGYPVLNLLLFRIIITIIMLGYAYFMPLGHNKFALLVRFIIVGGLLLHWYPETFLFNMHLTNQDAFMAQAEQNIFHCQPSILFEQHFPQRIIEELMNMGYFSLYPLVIFTSAFFFFRERKYFHRFFFILMFSFLAFYTIFIFFPVAGPQYYFAVIGQKQAALGIFPNIGNYFATHNVEPENVTIGFFDSIVNLAQKIGEKPTAAFPSSHVGIATLVMIMLLEHKKFKVGAALFPFYFFLVLSTVYIQAHYAIDAIAGFFTAFIFFYLGKLLYKNFESALTFKKKDNPAS